MERKSASRSRTKKDGLSVQGWVEYLVSPRKAPFAFFVSTLAIVLSYRIQLTWALFTRSIRPFDFDPSAHPIWLMVKFFPYDLSLALSCFTGSWGLSRIFDLLKVRGIRFLFTVAGLFWLHLLIILLFIIHGAHLRLLFEAQTGMSFFVLQEFLLNVPKAELVKFVDWKDGIFFLIPIGVFWGTMILPFVLRVRILSASIGFILLLCSTSLIGSILRPHALPSEIRLNPVLFFLTDMMEQGIFKSSSEGETVMIIREGDLSLQPWGKDFKEPMKSLKLLPPSKDHPWNIVFFIMESVGSRYAFDPGQGQSMPMPFLYKLSKESWHLKRHYTSSNISTKAIFSLLSGLYDFFHQETFGTRPDAMVPSLHSYLPKNYETFLVTPSPLQWYFPVAFVKNNGLEEIYHFGNLNLKMREEKHSLGRYIGRDEIETIDFFNQRIRKAREPFLGIYLSFAAHLPYFDYGPNYHVVQPDGRMISRYYNNLHLLDDMLKRVYETLKREGLLERTILVIVGDHGQAFGQHHSDNYMHHRYSYNENLETPAILHQPTLFKPKSIEVPTSHVDLLPTLLDAMRIPSVPEYLDGESLFHYRLRRKYIFVYGYEGTLTSIDQQFLKVQYSLKKKRCWAFDLKVDPEEKVPLDCSSFGNQLEALRRFVTFHDARLVKYNEAIKERRQWSEERSSGMVKGDP